MCIENLRTRIRIWSLQKSPPFEQRQNHSSQKKKMRKKKKRTKFLIVALNGANLQEFVTMQVSPTLNLQTHILQLICIIVESCSKVPSVSKARHSQTILFPQTFGVANLSSQYHNYSRKQGRVGIYVILEKQG